LVTRSFRQRLETRVPTQITCQTFKEHPEALGLGKWAVNRMMAHSLTAPAALRLGLQGARSIAPIGGLSTHCPLRFPGRKRPREGDRTAGAAALAVVLRTP